jgi:hypothetical protein
MRSRATILILGTAQFVMVLDTTVMNAFIPEVVADKDTSVPDVQLAITACGRPLRGRPDRRLLEPKPRKVVAVYAPPVREPDGEVALAHSR